MEEEAAAEAAVVEAVEAAEAEAAAVAAGRQPSRLVPLSASSLDLSQRTWVEDFVADLSTPADRRAPICPALPASIDADSLWIGRLEVDAGVELRRLTGHLRMALHDSVDHILNPQEALPAAMWIVEGVPPHLLRPLFEPAFETVRSDALSFGIMTGCFHPFRMRKSRVRPGVETMRSPLPSLAFRRAQRLDARSLEGEPSNLAILERFLRAHRTRAAIADQEFAIRRLGEAAAHDLSIA